MEKQGLKRLCQVREVEEAGDECHLLYTVERECSLSEGTWQPCVFFFFFFFPHFLMFSVTAE